MAHDAGKTIADLIADQVKKTPDYVSVVYDGLEEESTSQRITYSEMWQRANQVLEELQRCGAMKTTVGVCIEPDINLPSVLLGILRASSSFFPFGVDGLGFVKQSLEKLGVTYLLLDGCTLEVDIVPSEGLQTLGIYLGKVHGSRTGEGQLKPVPGLAYCITTSGTTGTPKVVRVPHTCIVPNILDFRKEFQPKIGDITFLTSPLTFDPSMIDIFMTLSSGAALLVAPAVVRMSGDSLLTMLTSRHKVTCLQITPSLFRRLDPGRVRSTLLGADSPLRLLAFGGEAFPSRTVLDVCLHPENCTRIYNVYGITEVSCWATLHCARPPKGSVKEPVPIGEALTGTRVKVVDECGIEVKTGTGQIMIGGSDRVCLLNEEGEQVLSEKGPWRRTGDVGLVHSDGSLYCLGRDDRQIKRHGKRLDLNTLEEVCCRKTTIEECRAVHKKDQLLLFFKTAAHMDAEEDQLCREVRCHLKDILPSQYQPDEVVLVSSFPVNSHGKLDVASLVQLLKRRTEQHRSLVPACVELWSGKLWQGTLGDQRRTVSPADSFLACGGDSLKAVHLVEQVQQHLGQDVPDLLDIVLTKTFADFVYFIRQKWKCNGCADESKLAKDHRNGELYIRKHDPGNHVDLSEPPVKVRKEASQSSCLDRTVLSDQEHFTSDTMSDISTPCIQKPNGRIIELAKKQEHTEGKKRTCHELFDRKSPKHVNKDAHITGTDMFICSISRASTCWSSSDSARTCEDISGKNNGNKFCSPLQEERERSIVELELQWACDTGKCVDASPLVGITKSGKTLAFIGSHSHRFFAVDVSSGTVVWSIQLGDRVESSACLSPCGRRVVVGCYDHQLYVLKADTGEVEWQVETGDVVKCSPVADSVSHLVFCGSHDGFLYAVNCNKQRVSWKSWMGGGGVFASPVLACDSSAVYTATLRGHVTAASTVTGTVVWRVSLGKPVFSSPAVYDDCLYMGCVDSCFYCLSCVTGLQMWIYRTEAPIFSSPVITTSSIGQKPCILFGCHDNCLYCITDTGELVWKHHTLSTVYASPFVFSLHGNIHFSQHLEKPEAQDVRSCFNGNHLSKNSKESISTKGLEWGCHVQAHTDMQKVDPQAAKKTNLLSEFGVSRHAACQSSLKNGEIEDALCCSQTGERSDLCIQGHLQKEKHNTNEIPGSELLYKVMQPDEDCVLCEQFVACASTEGSVTILSCATGSLIGEKTLPGEVFSSPVVVGRHLIVGCRDDRVYCYKLNLLRQLSA